jgi:Mce-associated membrane protein
LPPSRRQPRTTPPVRRPRVAGTRNPGTAAVSPSPKPFPRPASGPSPHLRPDGPERGALEDETPTFAFGPVVTEPAVDPEVTEPEPDHVDAFTGVPEAPMFSDAGARLATKPSPRPKSRDHGVQKPDSVAEAEAEVAKDRGTSARRRTTARRNPYLLVGALVIVGLLFVGAAVLFKIQDSKISSATSNTALLDVAKTAQAKDQVSKAAEALFSYDFNNIAKTENAAKDLLVGADVINKYDALMGEVKRLAPAQKMVVTCKVTRSGVIMLNGDLAKVMVFIDQTSTRADTQQTTAGSAQLHLNAQLQGDQWKITDMDTYIAPTPPQTPVPSPAPPSK